MLFELIGIAAIKIASLGTPFCAYYKIMEVLGYN
jgi:hypothetical protein